MGLLDIFTNNAGSIIGAMLGASSAGNTTTGATQSRDPWGPAQPHILRNLQNESDLQSYYQKTPFNAQQDSGFHEVRAKNSVDCISDSAHLAFLNRMAAPPLDASASSSVSPAVTLRCSTTSSCGRVFQSASGPSR